LKHQHIYYILFIAVVFISCKKDETPSYPTTNTGTADCSEAQGIKDYFYFKIGSWWVYEEETSGARDSVCVTEAIENPNNNYFDIRVYSNYQDFYYHYWPVLSQSSPYSVCPDNGLICHRCIKVIRSKYQPGNVLGDGTCFIYLPTEGDFDYVPNVYYENNKLFVDSIFDSYQLDTFQFNKTVKIHELNTIVEGRQPTNHYFSQDVGLVRKELLDSNEVWNLVNYYIQN